MCVHESLKERRATLEGRSNLGERCWKSIEGEVVLWVPAGLRGRCVKVEVSTWREGTMARTLNTTMTPRDDWKKAFSVIPRSVPSACGTLNTIITPRDDWKSLLVKFSAKRLALHRSALCKNPSISAFSLWYEQGFAK
jgi:hypothetical protein